MRESRHWWWNRPRFSAKDMLYLAGGAFAAAVLLRLPTIVGWFS